MTYTLTAKFDDFIDICYSLVSSPRLHVTTHCCFYFLEIPELQYLNRSVDPCENFYEFTCGNFKNVKPRPEDEPTWDHFTILQKEVYATVRSKF